MESLTSAPNQPNFFRSVLRKANVFSGAKAVVMYEPPVGHAPPYYLFFKHRYFRAFIFLLMCLLNTLVYYGWQPFSKMLYRSGAYKWQCTVPLVGEYDYCKEQKDSVQALLLVGMSSEFICGAIAGVFLDYFGPWLTGLTGSCSFFMGWMCLLYSSQSFQAYIPGMILLAGAVNFIAFPCLCISYLFPKYSGFAISLVVAAQTTGTAVAPIMKFVWDAHGEMSFSQIVWGYLVVAFLPCTLLYLLAVPYSRLTNEPVDTTKEFAPSSNTDSPQELNEVALEENNKGSTSNIELVTVEPSKNEVAISAAFIHPPSLFSQLCSLEYILFTLYYILQILQFGYYPTTVDERFGDSVSEFQGYILPTQGLFGAIFGLVVGKTGTLPICILLILMMTIAYALALIENIPLQFFTSILYVISNSYIYTVKYTYIAELYPATHFGVLTGLVGCFAGALGLINIPIHDADVYRITCLAYIMAGGISFSIIMFLWFRKRKGFHYRHDINQLTESKAVRTELL